MKARQLRFTDRLALERQTETATARDGVKRARTVRLMLDAVTAAEAGDMTRAHALVAKARAILGGRT